MSGIAERIIDAAEKHGQESDSLDHEVGDLQDALRAALNLMTESQLELMNAWANDYGLWGEG